MDKPSVRSSVTNSFLQETEQNSDVDDEIRLQIENRYQRSKTNKSYIFPRTQAKTSTKAKITGRKVVHNRYKSDLKSILHPLKPLNRQLTSTRYLNKHTLKHSKTKSDITASTKNLKSPYRSKVSKNSKLQSGVSSKTFSKIKSPKLK